jgi:hypothetical protein
MKKSQLPQWLERLVPPSSREHVLGDLAECSESNLEFLTNLASVLPGVIRSQLRRRIGWKAFIFGAAVDAYVLGAVQAYFHAPFLDQGLWSWARLGTVWAAWIAGAALAAAYRPEGQSNHWSFRGWIKAAIVATGMAVALRVPVAGVVVALGTIIAFWSMLILVLSMPWLKMETLQQPLVLDKVPERARIFQRGIWWRNARESIVAVFLVVGQGSQILRIKDISEGLEPFLLLAGVLFIIYYLHFRANSRSVPDGDVATVLRFHCHELKRQRDILRTVPLWYLFPLVPGMIVGVLGNDRGASGLVGLFGIAGIFALVWGLNAWGAKWLDSQLQEANALLDEGARGAVD